MITNVILILYNRSINNKLILRYLCFRHHIACFCSIFPTLNYFKQLQQGFASLSNMIVIRFWMIQPFKLFGSVAVTHLLPVTFCHLLAILISHLKSFVLKIILNISIQCFMFKMSKIMHLYLHVKALNVLLSCIKCVNTSKCYFRCNFCKGSFW